MDFLPVDVFSSAVRSPPLSLPFQHKETGSKSYSTHKSFAVFFFAIKSRASAVPTQSPELCRGGQAASRFMPAQRLCSWMQFAPLPRRPSVTGRACTENKTSKIIGRWR